MPTKDYINRARSQKDSEETELYGSYQADLKSGLYPTICVSMVVARNRDKFCSTDEKNGWYLPAGRCNALEGESFATRAQIQSFNEAGLDANLTGIHRLEFTPEKNCIRIRVIFGARAIGSPELKQDADKESFGAQWLTLEDLKEKKLRHKEVLHLFKWVESGTELYPMEVLHLSEGTKRFRDETIKKTLKEREVEKYVSELFVKVQVVFMARNEREPKFLLNYDGTLPSLPFDKPNQSLEQSAKDVIQSFALELCGEQADPESILEVSHVANEHFTVTFLATFEPRSKEGSFTSGNWSWVPLKVAKDAGLTEDTQRVLQKAQDGFSCPLSLICKEGTTYSKKSASPGATLNIKEASRLQQELGVGRAHREPPKAPL